jgi:sigma-B regulation protein RsbU (phosphoserine phosphatase)
LTYARAGHNPPRLVRRDSVLSLDATGELPLGIMAEETYTQSQDQLESGDLLLFYTDGITEAAPPIKKGDTERNLFTLERLDNLLLNHGSDTAEACISRIRTEVAAFSENAPPGDDQTLIAIRCL